VFRQPTKCGQVCHLTAALPLENALGSAFPRPRSVLCASRNAGTHHLLKARPTCDTRRERAVDRGKSRGRPAGFLLFQQFPNSLFETVSGHRLTTVERPLCLIIAITNQLDLHGCIRNWISCWIQSAPYVSGVSDAATTDSVGMRSAASKTPFAERSIAILSRAGFVKSSAGRFSSKTPPSSARIGEFTLANSSGELLDKERLESHDHRVPLALPVIPISGKTPAMATQRRDAAPSGDLP